MTCSVKGNGLIGMFIVHTHTHTHTHTFTNRRDILRVTVRLETDYREAVTNLDRALLSQSYAILLLYTELPPGSSMEYYTLVLQKNGEEPSPQVHKNTLHVTADRCILYINDYKNVKYHGIQCVPTDETPKLKNHLLNFIVSHRPLLVAEGVDRVFVVSEWYLINSTTHTNLPVFRERMECRLIHPIGPTCCRGSFTNTPMLRLARP